MGRGYSICGLEASAGHDGVGNLGRAAGRRQDSEAIFFNRLTFAFYSPILYGVERECSGDSHGRGSKGSHARTSGRFGGALSSTGGRSPAVAASTLDPAGTRAGGFSWRREDGPAQPLLSAPLAPGRKACSLAGRGQLG